MKTLNLTIDSNDLKTLWMHTKAAYGNKTFESWKKDSEKSYMSYFENKQLFNIRKFTYSQFVNAQILSIT